MSIQIIVVLVIAVIILVSLVVFYTKSAGPLFGSIKALGAAGNNTTGTAIEGIEGAIGG